MAEDTPKPPPTLEGVATAIDTVWVLVTAFLVFFMQAGFACVEAGFTRAKNTCNILAKNFIDFCVASIIFFLVGYAVMFGKGNDFIGWTGFGLSGAENPSGVPLYAYWLFQAVFCGTAATIVSGSMAERTKFAAYLCYTFVISAVIYPVIGHWTWGGGWLSQMGFADFAGSTVVHSVGGWMALTGAIMLGPRIGKYTPDGKAKAIAGHNIPLAALGVFILWFGWFGFNPGSTLGVTGSNLETVGLIAINTNLAAAAGGLLAMTTVWMLYGKPDVSMTMNGILAGLVAITAPCAYVSPGASIVIGAIGGVLVVLGVGLLDKLHIDDPVGAVPVHAFNGVWGTLSVGIWGQKALGLANDGVLHGGGLTQLGVQALGALAAAAFSMVVMAIFFAIIKATVGLRVSSEEELRGLDIDEHGMEAYSDFQIFTTR
ncbi:MAG: ammonium transporter [Pseudomonadota bacterium]